MNSAIIVFVLTLTFSLCAHADEIVSSPQKTFKIVTKREKEDWTETVYFTCQDFAPISLASYPWSGGYSISPDERWILRIQKTGSGQSIGILYAVEPTGRVSEIIDFNSLAWRFSDSFARLKWKELYHTGIISAVWQKNGRTLSLVLRGTNGAKSGDGIEEQLEYDLVKHTFKTKKANNAVQPTR